LVEKHQKSKLATSRQFTKSASKSALNSKNQWTSLSLSEEPIFNFRYKTVGTVHLLTGKLVEFQHRTKEAKVSNTVIVSVSRIVSEVKTSKITDWMHFFGKPIGEPYNK